MKSLLKQNLLLRESYIYIRYIVYRYLIKFSFKRFKVLNNTKLSDISLNKDDSSFFGYYNIIPINEKNDILFCSTITNKTRGSKYEPINICIYKHNSTKTIYKSKAWNWQQGCMLQWYPKNRNNILLNDYDSEKEIYISKIIDNAGKTLKSFDLPINYVSNCGKYALCLNYDRLSLLRPDYGYFNKKELNIPSDDKDGIWYLDLNNGDKKLIVTYTDLKRISYNETMKGAVHKINHIDINPSSKRFMFLHRWIGSKGRFMRLITANPDGSEILILNGDKMTSHCTWLDDENILSFCYVKDKGTGYFKFKDFTSNVSFFSKKLPLNDGHPSISPNKRYILTDTYPDLSRMSKLYVYDIFKDNIIYLGRFYQPLKYTKEKRIDLHPKWSHNSNGVFFESGHQGKRKLYYMDISHIVNN